MIDMQQWPEHSLRGYLTRLPTYKLELILKARNLPHSNTVLTAEDYAFIESILRTRKETTK